MNATTLAAWWGAGLSTITAAGGGIRWWWSRQTRLRVSLFLSYAEDDDGNPTFDLLAVRVVNRSEHPVQIVACYLESGGTRRFLRIARPRGEVTVSARQQVTLEALEDDVPFHLWLPLRAVVEVGTGDFFYSPILQLAPTPPPDLLG